MKLLIIEDEEHMVELLENEISNAIADVECYSSDFAGAETRIGEIRPDVIVLDLLLSGNNAEAETPGLDTREFIWSEHFCPIIVHSADPSHHDDSSEEHPFVRSIQKGRGSPGEVVGALNDFGPHMEALRRAKGEIQEQVEKAFAQAMRDVAPQVFMDAGNDGDADQRAEAINRAGRRRLGAFLEGESADDVRSAWEMYLCPPASGQILLGDVLRQVAPEGDNGGAAENPESDFFVVVSPSCDLVCSQTRNPSVSSVLTARCTATRRGVDKTVVGELPGNDVRARDRIKRHLLTAGHSQGILPLPGYRDVIPTMVADLRDLCLIPIAEIGDEASYRRVASMNSPYRELVSWAYQQVACRPGLPNRDFEAWSRELLADYRRYGNA